MFCSVSWRRLLFSNFFNSAVSFVYSLTGESDYRLISCRENITWVDNESVVSSEDISDHRNDLWIGMRITSVFCEDGCIATAVQYQFLNKTTVLGL